MNGLPNLEALGPHCSASATERAFAWAAALVMHHPGPELVQRYTDDVAGVLPVSLAVGVEASAGSDVQWVRARVVLTRYALSPDEFFLSQLGLVEVEYTSQPPEALADQGDPGTPVITSLDQPEPVVAEPAVGTADVVAFAVQACATTGNLPDPSSTWEDCVLLVREQGLGDKPPKYCVLNAENGTELHGRSVTALAGLLITCVQQLMLESSVDAARLLADQAQACRVATVTTVGGAVVLSRSLSAPDPRELTPHHLS